MDELWSIVRTPAGSARVRLVDRWIAVASTGELLERDVWEVAFHHRGVEVVRRMRTLPEPDGDALEHSVRDLLRVAGETRGA